MKPIPKYFTKSWFSHVEEARGWYLFLFDFMYNEKAQFNTWAEGAD